MQINLLPWREELIRQNKNRFNLLVVASGVAYLIVLLFIYLIFSHRYAYIADNKSVVLNAIQQEESALQSLKASNQAFIQMRDIILMKFKVKNQINHMIYSLQEIKKISENLVKVTKFSMADNKIILSGISSSADNITRYIKIVTDSPLFKNVELVQVSRDNAGNLEENQFTVNFTLE